MKKVKKRNSHSVFPGFFMLDLYVRLHSDCVYFYLKHGIRQTGLLFTRIDFF